MSEAKKILEMIEVVADCDDLDTLDEIDGEVCRYLGIIELDDEYPIPYLEYPKRYIAYRFTRSRDALKSIRPEGWEYFNELDIDYYKLAWLIKRGEHEVRSPYNLPTEELAELHAIIQAIEWERNNGE